MARDDRVSGFFWHELQLDCPIVRLTEVTPLSPEFLQKCEVVLANEEFVLASETAELKPDRVLIARSQSPSGTHIKDFTIYRECAPA